MRHKSKKSLLVSLLLFAASAFEAFGCWYQKSSYTDYIYSINDNAVISISKANDIAHYQVANNKIVDLPITVSMKLISDEVIDIGDGQTSSIGNITGKLQYRVLPNGDWVTASEYSVQSGKISKDSKPSAYFGSYNIWPKNLKAGDVIMIRLYVTDGMWQSGELRDRCEIQLQNVSTKFGTRRSLPNQFSYDILPTSLVDVDLGGNWYPHLAVTVQYSGNERPLK